MATAAEIDAVKLQLPDEAEAFGITDQVISDQIDSGKTQTKTILFSLRAIAAKATALEDISESGSSRSQRLHERVLELIRDWTLVETKEELESAVVAKEAAKIHTAERV